MKTNLLEKVEKLNEMEKLIIPGDSIVVGVSGGPDSICLLHILEQLQKNGLNFKITVAHVNHMIRENAKLDEKYVTNYCTQHEIPIFVKKFDVEEYAKKNKIGTEEAGRKIRYDFFEEISKKTKANKIATAHNANDNAETVILNIIRGCGVDGLKGIEAQNGKYIRPLINIKRCEIEAYCDENKLDPRIDESNKELIYQRNKVRNVMIPYIEQEFNDNFVETINRLSKIAKEDASYLEGIIKSEYEKVLIKEQEGIITLDLKQFNLLDIVIKKGIIRYTINKVLGNIQGLSVIHVDDIITMCSKNIGNKYLTPNKKIKVGIKNKKIFFEAI